MGFCFCVSSFSLLPTYQERNSCEVKASWCQSPDEDLFCHSSSLDESQSIQCLERPCTVPVLYFIRSPPPPVSPYSEIFPHRVITTPFLLHFFFFLIIYLFHVCEHTVAVFRHTRKGSQISLQVFVSHHIGSWELNSGPLQKQSVLLTAEPSLQPPPIFLSTILLFPP